MQYKLVFTKTDPSHKVAGVGVGGNVMMVLSMISNMTDDDTLYVDMETNGCIWREEDYPKKGNPWEYFFWQDEIRTDEELTIRTIFETGKTNFKYDDKTIGSDLSIYRIWRNRFWDNFEIRSPIKNTIEIFYDEFIKGKVTLGVQIRLTDMQHHHKTKDVMASVVKIKEILQEHPEIEQVFLATDDETAIALVKYTLPIPVIYYKNIYRATENHRDNDPYDRLNSDRPLHRYLLGKECLMDIFTLTKCDYLLKADQSAISIVACILAENIKKVYTL